jgi:hypothetical protein
VLVKINFGIYVLAVEEKCQRFNAYLQQIICLLDRVAVLLTVVWAKRLKFNFWTENEMLR